MIKKKSFIYLAVAVGLLVSTQTLKETSEAQVGYVLAERIRQAKDQRNVDTPSTAPKQAVGKEGTAAFVQGASTATGAVLGTAAGTWAAAKIGSGIGSAIAPGIGTILGAGVGAL